MSSYEALASSYDGLTHDVDYAKWADGLAQLLEKNKPQSLGNVLLDFACGTGSMTIEMAKRGYEMICVDGSSEMLMVASGKEYPESSPIFLCQPMERLDLYGTIDGCICSLDSLNYLTDYEKLKRAIGRVGLFMLKGGSFLFDVKTTEHFAKQDGQITVDETEESYCVWRSEFEESSGLCRHEVDLFEKRGQGWMRSFEEHTQRGYSEEEVRECLVSAGFTDITVSEHFEGAPVGRLFYSAIKGENSQEKI
ncbi:MAG: class I SAM-dependent methyltransferase [Eubacteriales bacterium]